MLTQIYLKSTSMIVNILYQKKQEPMEKGKFWPPKNQVIYHKNLWKSRFGGAHATWMVWVRVSKKLPVTCRCLPSFRFEAPKVGIHPTSAGFTHPRILFGTTFHSNSKYYVYHLQLQHTRKACWHQQNMGKTKKTHNLLQPTHSTFTHPGTNKNTIIATTSHLCGQDSWRLIDFIVRLHMHIFPT